MWERIFGLLIILMFATAAYLLGSVLLKLYQGAVPTMYYTPVNCDDPAYRVCEYRI